MRKKHEPSEIKTDGYLRYMIKFWMYSPTCTCGHLY